jgi:GNAT superfamily N-acetyltransferase
LTAAQRLSAPQRLKENHVLDGFDCGKDALNHWLRSHAMANQKADYTKVMVVSCGMAVIGYYGLSMSSVHRDEVPKKIKQHPAPVDIPCLLIGQLAVDHRWRGQGVGVGLLKDALIRAVDVADKAGTRAIVVNALDDEAGEFWLKMGFLPAKGDSQTFFRKIEDVRATLAAAIRQMAATP